MSDLTISLIQASLHWENPEANRQMFASSFQRMDQRTELVLLPEMFSTGFSMDASSLAETMDGPTVSWMRDMAATHRKVIAGSLIIREGEDYFNRLVWMLPNGQFGHYDKRHCFGLAGEDKHFTPGNKRLIASVKGWRINLCICYDLRFPVWSRQQKVGTEAPLEPEYDLLVYVANWPDRRIHAWKTLLPARAIENQCYVAAVNRIGDDGHGIAHSGHSMVIDPMGDILDTAHDQETILTCTLKKSLLLDTRAKLPFWKDADSFLIR
ncbi:MAG: amidohydrolase [Chitinophagaceae bacterium]|jgi:predicted amidohydrolase|nr:amidohydrolase [Chitinophagaceae bacterium]